MNEQPLPDRHRPAHHPPIERVNEPVIVLVTICTQDRRPVLACNAVHRLCREIWQAADFWHVGRYVVMPDHVHLFCAPGRIPMPGLRQWVEFWKSRIARWVPLVSGRPIYLSAGRADATEGVPPKGNAEWIYGGPASVRAGIGNPDETELVPPEGRKPISLDATEGVPPEGGEPKKFKLWQRDFWDTQMRSREHYDEKWSYVRMNPVRQGLVQTPDDWPFHGEVFPLAWR